MDFKHIRYWAEHYAHPGVSDQSSVENAMICESDEFLRPFQAQLNSIIQGSFDEQALDRILTTNRRQRHGSYENWAKLMLMWIQGVKKH